jgi:PAS domain S-box-containing protein
VGILNGKMISKMFKEAEIGFWIQKIDVWEIIWANEKFSKILNIQQSEVLGCDVRNFFNNDVVSFLGSFLNYEPKIIRTKGIGKGINTDIQIAVGTIDNTYLYGIVRNITQDEMVYYTLKTSEKRFKSLIEATRAGMTITNPEGVIVFSNESFSRLLGFQSSHEVIGKNISKFVAEHEILIGMDDFTKIQLTQKDGKRKDILISIDPLNTSVEYTGYVGILANLPKEISTRLKQERIMNEFMQITVHEMATPINLVKGFTELLLKNYNRERGFNEVIIESLLRNTKKLERQIVALRDVQDTKEGIFTIDKKPLHFNELITYLKSDIDIMGERARIKLDFKDTRESKTEFELDLDRMAQVVYNLIENGCHHSAKTKDVLIKILLASDNLEIKIKDYGVGFSEEKLKLAFTPFFSESTEYYKKGMGLGLYISRTIVNKHGGKISLVSELGKGSEFLVSIPI